MARRAAAWLGREVQTVTDDLAESIGLDKPRGALVADVTEGSPGKPQASSPVT